MDELIQEFLAEAKESLDRFDQELVKLEADPESPDLLSSIFRSIHSIKGACGFLGFQKLEALAHAGENLLSKLRDRQLKLTEEIGSSLLAMGDGLRQMLAAIQENGTDGDNDFGEQVAKLTSLHGTVQKSAEEPKKEDPKKKEPKKEEKKAEETKKEEKKPDRAIEPPKAKEAGGANEPVPPARAAEPAPKGARAGTEAQEGARSKLSKEDSTIRVNVTLLDRLMDLVGELVLARNQILQVAGRQEEAAFAGTLQRLNLVTSELREGVMKTRMQPISRLFDKVPRVARDVGVACGKRVQVETEGKETELDRTLLEALNDPLTHLVRNAIDHGVENPERRVAAGKPPEGRVQLRAVHEGGQVTIEISDDGAGIDVERIRAKAVERGVLTPERAARMGGQEALQLILLPGITTAEKVTNVSGRGVGMDVVKTNIEHVGGSIEIQTQKGKGTTFRIKLPLTLAIVPALIVRSGGQRFAVPQVNLLELVRPEGERNGIEWVQEVPVYRLRGRLLPLVYLNRELHLAEKVSAGSGQAVNIVVLQVGARQFGLVVDEVQDSEEIVVKPLSKLLKGQRVYAGATIMGDGQTVLILDVLGLAQSANVAAKELEEAKSQELVDGQLQAQRKKFVLFAGPGGSRMALPLGALARLEDLAGARVERSGREWVAQYREGVLPLIRVSHALQEVDAQSAEEPAFPPAGNMHVLVVQHEGQQAGLVVEDIVDIVEESVDVQRAATRPGVLYSAVLAGRVTELLDVPAILAAGERSETDKARAMEARA